MGVSGYIERHAGLHEERMYLLVSLAEHTFGIDASLVGPIVEQPPITPVPNTPSFILGVCSIHGTIHSVVDICPLLSGESRFSEDDSVPVVAIVTGPEFSCGVVVESAGELLHISDTAITDSSATVPYVAGVFHHGDDPVLILDVPALMKNPEMTQFR